MIIDKFKRIIKAEFDEAIQDTIEKLSFSLNNTLEALVNAFSSKQISLKDNIQCTVKTINTTVDASGTPLTTLSFKSDVPQKPIGVICISAVNTVSSTSYSSNGISVAYSSLGDTIIINNITGLVANNKYLLTLVAFS